jgi:hypothetical protein
MKIGHLQMSYIITQFHGCTHANHSRFFRPELPATGNVPGISHHELEIVIIWDVPYCAVLAPNELHRENRELAKLWKCHPQRLILNQSY